MLGDAAHERAADDAVAMRAHHDEMGFLALGGAHDLLAGRTHGPAGLELEVVAGQEAFDGLEDLAGLVGASRERVNKALSLFTRLGWIQVEGRNRYRILDRESLTDRATL